MKYSWTAPPKVHKFVEIPYPHPECYKVSKHTHIKCSKCGFEDVLGDGQEKMTDEEYAVMSECK